ncbi:MAG TPA: hypothetical protein G4N92_04310 [Anaerolineae bacterium]|nr:hypothetical protein [Anaerolineae bacterium]
MTSNQYLKEILESPFPVQRWCNQDETPWTQWTLWTPHEAISRLLNPRTSLIISSIAKSGN